MLTAEWGKQRPGRREVYSRTTRGEVFTTEWGECDYNRIGEGKGGGRMIWLNGWKGRRGKGEGRCLQ